MTGGTETCILIGGTVRRAPVAEIEIETPYYQGQVKAVCMENPLHDGIIGNVPGVTDNSNDMLETKAVVYNKVTRQKSKLSQ